MIKANITEIKNRLSHYIRLVRGGEQIEILDRKTPLARIVGITDSQDAGNNASWVKHVQDLGIVKPPEMRKTGSEFISQKGIVTADGKTCGVLDALLEERNVGR